MISPTDAANNNAVVDSIILSLLDLTDTLQSLINDQGQPIAGTITCYVIFTNPDTSMTEALPDGGNGTALAAETKAKMYVIMLSHAELNEDGIESNCCKCRAGS